jgi:o-succinylbenzoate synthase
VKILGGALRPFCLPLLQPLSTAHGPILERVGRLIRLEDEQGGVGFGEATPLPEFGTEDLADCDAAIRAGMTRLLESCDSSRTTPDEAILPACRLAPSARAAFECALEDLRAQRAGVTLAASIRRRALLPGDPADFVRVQCLVAGDTPEAVAQAATRAWARGERAFKLKLAVSPALRGIEADLERVAALRDSVGPEAMIRLDANEAWSLGEAQSALSSLACFGIDYVEQPIARGDLAGLARLDREAPVAVAADEALLGDGLERCLERRAASILIVKPAALGGIGPAIELLARARALELRVVWSTLLDAAVSRCSVLHLAAALGPHDEFHGLATGSLLACDVAEYPVASGRIPIPISAPAGLGLGATLELDADSPVWRGPPEFFEAGR